MQIAPLLYQGLLVRRYKRFLADITDAKGESLTIHCPNTGAMTNCAEAGWALWYSRSDNPRRKYAATWEVSVTPQGEHILVNTTRVNALVLEVLQAQAIDALAGYGQCRAEVPFGRENSRMDFVLSQHEGGKSDAVVEVKSVTLLAGSQGQGFFPDAPSLRGQRHLRELMAAVRLGLRAVLLFCVNHEGIDSVTAADTIDPIYGRLLQEARAAGVEVYAYKSHFAWLGPGQLTLTLTQEVPVLLMS